VTEILMDNFEFLAPKQNYAGVSETSGYDANNEYGTNNIPPPPSSDQDDLPF